MKHHWLWKMMLIGGLAIGTAQAQVTVRKNAVGKIDLDLSAVQTSGPSASTLLQVLRADLLRSGWFTEAPAGQGAVRLLGTVKERRGFVDASIQAINTAAEKYYVNKSWRQPQDEARRLAHVIADELVEAVTGQKGIASTRIVMVGDRTGRKELYLCDADGGGLFQLTPDKSVSVSPAWSPDAEQIVYTGYLKGFPDLYRITLQSGDRDRIAGYPGLNTGGAYSPDGTRMAIILSRDGNPELYVKNLENGRLTRLTRTGRGNESSPSWSPDGRRIVYVSDTSGRPQLYILSASGGQPERLTARGSENVAPDWGANGWIAYTSRIGGRYQVMMIQPDSLDIRQVSTGFADWEDPSWAPNGRHVVCSRRSGSKSELYILDTQGDAPIPLKLDSGNWFSPAWSPK